MLYYDDDVRRIKGHTHTRQVSLMGTTDAQILDRISIECGPTQTKPNIRASGIYVILSAFCRRKGFIFSATFMDIPSRKMPLCMAVVAQATR